MNQNTVQLVIVAAIVAACAVYVVRSLFFKKKPAPRQPGCDGACGRCGGCH